MFGSKNKQQKKHAEVNIETMEGNLKGEGEKQTVVEYGKTKTEELSNDKGVVSTKSNVPPDKISTPSPSSSIPTPTISDAKKQEAPFKSPFNNNGLSDNKTGSVEKNKIGQGSFSATVDKLSTEVPKKDNSAFLHQAIDGKINNKEPLPNKEPNVALPKKRNRGRSSFLLVVLFIILLAGIIFGGYYFYMNKSSAKPEINTKTETKKQPVKQTNKTVNKTNISTKNSTKKTTTQKAPATPTVEKLITSPATFNQDIARFITELKRRRSAVDLQNGIFISPMATTEQPLPASKLLESLRMTTFFNEADLKSSCKIFAIEDSGEIKLAVIFELSETADEKLVKNNILQKENELMARMAYLFVDVTKPVVPAEIKFATNPNNMQARYANYTPGVDTFSVDWNILDLGKGKLVYFATSRKTAKVLTDYFMRTVTK